MISLSSDSSPSTSPSPSASISSEDHDGPPSPMANAPSSLTSSLSPPGLSTFHADLATSPITGGFASQMYLTPSAFTSPMRTQSVGSKYLRHQSSSVDEDAVHDALSPTHVSPAQLYSTESGRLFHAGKICIVLVGLPARGKTHLAVSLTRYLRWLGVKTHAFHLGDYRRVHIAPGTDVPDDYFLVNASPSTVILRQRVMAACKADVYRFFEEDRGQVAIYDAVNPTSAGRRVLVKEFSQRGIQTLFIESICDRPEIIEANVRSVKISSPDYIGWNEKEAIKHYLKRISDKIPHYETLDEPEFSYIKLYNAGERILLNNSRMGYLPNRIVFYLMNLHIKSGCVYFARAGRSTEQMPRYKSDPHLSDEGRTYARILTDTLLEHRRSEHTARRTHGDNSPERELIVWTSTRRRTVETSAEFEKRGFSCRQRPQLSQMHPGSCDGLSWQELEKQFPEEVEVHKKDPYRHRFPRAESYHDLAVRLEPVILEMERIPNDILIIAHVSVLRVLYGYLMACSPFDIPALDFERNEIVEIIPSAYNNKVKRIKIYGVEESETL
ncbi:6-phosphofructo-2-kinase-domain-containing protein [Lipomyces chichibuensis]|uniref:6-phosphofructo-2-kinase-domain-containing protein n=1 Tax=Lipomyces chichibuensis TaxID=1546026 RepID=UPI003343DBD9